MAEVRRLAEHRREYIADGDGSALRATWHSDAGYIVLSLWRGDTCVATSHLTPEEGGRLATFITGCLADLAQEVMSSPGVTTLMARPTWRGRLVRGVRSWAESTGSTLQRIARRLRPGP